MIFFIYLRLCLVSVKCFLENIFIRNAISGKKNIQAVWLPQNSFYVKLILVFDSFKHFYRKFFI